MICNNCKKEVELQDKFCPDCGNKLDSTPREPGEIKGMIVKIDGITKLSPKDKDNVCFLLTLYIIATVSLKWCLGEMEDEQFLRFFKEKVGERE